MNLRDSIFNALLHKGSAVPSPALAAHFAVSPAVTGPALFAGTASGFFGDLAYAQIDTPEKRAALVAQAMALYDATAAAFSKTRPLVAMEFTAMRPTVQTLLANELETLANQLKPQPVPVPSVV